MYAFYRHVCFVLLMAAGCLETNPPDAGISEDASTEPDGDERPLSLVVFAPDGTEHGLESVPWHPSLELLTTRHLEELWLIRTDDLPALVEDLERAPLRVAHRERAAELRLQRHPDRIVATPLEALEPGAYALAVPAWGDPKGVGAIFPITVSEDGGARLIESWPPEETSGVPMNLPRVFARFSGPVRGSLVLRGPHGAVDHQVATMGCSDVGWPSGYCVVLRLEGDLQPHARYVLDAQNMQDQTGRALSELFQFHTVESAIVPEPQPSPCGIDEQATDLGCLFVNDESAQVRVRFSAPALMELHTPFGHVRAVATRGEATLIQQDVPPATRFRGELRLRAMDGSLSEHSVELETTPALPRIVLSEVGADPAGPEPHQEFVEIFNHGDAEISLSGWRLSDSAGREGDGLHGVLPAGARALLVSDAFDPVHPADGNVPLGVLLVRIGTSIASGGLSNSGEPLFLRDADGQRIAEFPAKRSAGSGICWSQPHRARRPLTVDAAPCTPGSE